MSNGARQEEARVRANLHPRRRHMLPPGVRPDTYVFIPFIESAPMILAAKSQGSSGENAGISNGASIGPVVTSGRPRDTTREAMHEGNNGRTTEDTP